MLLFASAGYQVYLPAARRINTLYTDSSIYHANVDVDSLFAEPLKLIYEESHLPA